jgi:hypothetical protein
VLEVALAAGGCAHPRLQSPIAITYEPGSPNLDSKASSMRSIARVVFE